MWCFSVRVWQVGFSCTVQYTALYCRSRTRSPLYGNVRTRSRLWCFYVNETWRNFHYDLLGVSSSTESGDWWCFIFYFLSCRFHVIILQNRKTERVGVDRKADCLLITVDADCVSSARSWMMMVSALVTSFWSNKCHNHMKSDLFLFCFFLGRLVSDDGDDCI